MLTFTFLVLALILAMVLVLPALRRRVLIRRRVLAVIRG